MQLSMEGIAVEYFSNSSYTGSNKTKSEFHSYISYHNELDVCNSRARMFYLFLNFESGILVPDMSTVW